MTLNELKGKYARLSNEIDALAAQAGRNEASLMRLMNELDEVHGALSALRRRTFAAPTLRDALPPPPVVWPWLANRSADRSAG
jgi:hypothetical protein